MVNQDEGNSTDFHLFQVLGMLLEYGKIKQHDRRRKAYFTAKVAKEQIGPLKLFKAVSEIHN